MKNFSLASFISIVIFLFGCYDDSEFDNYSAQSLIEVKLIDIDGKEF